MIRIRLAQLDDVPAILAISNWAALNTPANFAIEPEALESWHSSFLATHEKYPWLVASDENGRVIGFAKASPWKGRCAYAYAVETSVYVDPEHHGRGLGTALYARLLPMLQEQGYHTALGGITIPNPASVRLHESFGMECVGVLRRVGWKFGRWHDVGYWQIVFGHADDEPPADGVRSVAEVFEGRA